MSFSDIYLWVLTAIALIGTVLNVKQQRIGFVFWMVSNLGFAISNALMGIYPISFLFSIYFFLAVAGWNSWKKKEEEQIEQAAVVIETSE